MSLNDCLTEPKLIDAKTCANLCGISRSMWYKLGSAGRTPAPIRLGGRTLWRRSDIDSWLWHKCPNRDEFDALPF